MESSQKVGDPLKSDYGRIALTQRFFFDRHPSEKMFGVQICGSRPQSLVPAAEAIVKSCDIDFLGTCPQPRLYVRGYMADSTREKKNRRQLRMSNRFSFQ